MSKDIFQIYQIKQGEDYHYQRFVNSKELAKQGIEPNIADYDITYNGNLDDIPYQNKLDGIYQKFNIDKPSDFKGHSLSVSDVIVTKINGNKTAYFIDNIGFKELPNFFVECKNKIYNNGYQTNFDKNFDYEDEEELE